MKEASPVQVKTEEKKEKETMLDNPLVQGVIVIVAVVAFILILAWRLGGLKDFEIGQYQEPVSLTEVVAKPGDYAGKGEIKIAGVIFEATGSSDFVLRQDAAEILVKPQPGLHPQEFMNRGLIGVGGNLTEQPGGQLILEAVSFEILDLDADAARARAQLMAENVKPILTKELGFAEGKLRITQAEEVDWPDASLGAPEPGRMYAQVLLKGYRLIFAENSTVYEVHTDRDGNQVILVKPERLSLKSNQESVNQ